MGSERTSTLVDDVGMLQLILVAGVDKGVHCIVDIFLDAVVHRVAAGTVARAVIVNAQSAANVHQFDVIAQFAELHIELCCFAQGILDAANHRHLAADVEVDELQAVHHVVLFEVVQCSEQFARVQPELAAVAAALFPLAAARTGELDADADIGTDTHAMGYLVDQDQLVEFLDHQKDASAHLLCQQGQLDVATVFVAVADDGRVGLDVGHVDGKHGMKFGLRAGFKTDVETAAMRHQFFHDRLHLVHLDGIDDEVLALVLIFFGCLLEATCQLFNSVVQDVGKTQQRGS